MVAQAVDDARHAARHGRAGDGHAVAERIARAQLDRHAGLLHQLGQLQHERHHEAVEIGAGDILQVAARPHARLDALAHDAHIVIDRLPARHLQLVEDVVIRAADQDARLLHADLAHHLKVLARGANPAGDLRVLIAALHAAQHRVPVLLGIQEELALADDAVRPAQAVQHVEDVHDLLGRVRLARLLPVAERRIRDPDLLRHGHGHMAHVERDARDVLVIEHDAVEVRFRHILQHVVELVLLQ